MTLAGARVHVLGRLHGLTQRRIAHLLAQQGAHLARKGTASVIVVAHSSAKACVSDAGTFVPGFDLRPGAEFVSEAAFRRRVGLAASPPATTAAYPAEQLGRLSGLSGEQIRCLELYDLLAALEGRFGYADLAAARAAGRMLATGARFGRIVAAMTALQDRGVAVAGARLTQAPWGEVVQDIEGRLAGLDGQFLLPIENTEVDADTAFARGEAAEADADLAGAERWYRLAEKLDRADAVLPFNLGNVLDAQGRPADAALAYRDAIARNPRFADAWFNLAILQERAGQDDEALASYRQAFLVEPGYTDALHNAAALLMRLRRFAEALALWSRLLDAAPERADIRRLAQLCRLEMQTAAAGRAKP